MTKYNAKELIQSFKTNLDPNLTVADYIALFILSLRDCFWQIDGRQMSKKLLKSNNILGLSGGIMMYMIGYLGWLPLCMMLVFTPFGCIASAIGHIFSLEIFAAIKMLLVGVFGTIFVAALIVLWYIPMVTDWDKLQYNLNFTKSAWWKNTGIRPSEIKKDKGIYGEYIATMAAEQCLKKNKVYGRVLNSAFVPKGNGNFNEIDIISVNETGIHVIEVKAKGGAFYGKISDREWTQKLGNEEYPMENPLVQNNGHRNCLLEYLYRVLPDGSLKDKATFVWNVINVVLFTTREVEDHLTYNITPKEFFFGMATGKDSYQKLNIVDMYKRRFTREEVDQIADALESIAHYSQAEQKRMIQQREMMREERKMLRKKGLLKNKDQFYVATVESVTADSDKETNVLICHDNGENITYLDMDNYIFIALPSGKPTPLSASYQSLPEAVAAYRKIVG